MPASRFYHFASQGIYYSVASASEAVASLKEGGYIWLNLYCPSKEELTELTASLGIHPLSVEDCLDTSQVPKIEHFSDNTFFIFNSYSYHDGELAVDEVDFFLGKDFLVTVCGINSEGREPLSGVESYIEKDPGLAKSSSAFLMHLVLDFVVDRKFNTFETLEDQLEEYEDLIIENTAKFEAANLVGLRKVLANLRKSLFHEREILIKICRKDCPFIKDREIIHFRDIYDHLAKFFELTESHRETVTSLMELYSSLLNNLMTRMSNETNKTVRRLTIITTVFMPLTLIASIFGMSEWSMITGPDNWRISYPVFFLAMAIIGIVNFFLIKRLGNRG